MKRSLSHNVRKQRKWWRNRLLWWRRSQKQIEKQGSRNKKKSLKNRKNVNQRTKLLKCSICCAMPRMSMITKKQKTKNLK